MLSAKRENPLRDKMKAPGSSPPHSPAAHRSRKNYVRAFWQSWLRLTTVAPAANVSLTEREQCRHARLLSLFLLATVGTIVLLIPETFLGGFDWGVTGGEFLVAVCVIGSILLNRRHRTEWASLLLLSGIACAIAWSILAPPGGLALRQRSSFDFFVIPIVLAGILLPRKKGSLIWLGCLLFTVCDFSYAPRQADLNIFIQHVGLYTVIATPAIMMSVIALVSWIAAESVERALHETIQAQGLRQVNTELAALATTDHLTHLLNHRALITEVDRELERCRRYERSCAIVFLDIDHFKALNDGYGHAHGDQVLCEFAEIITTTIRAVDILGRWGGEEFLILLPEVEGDTAMSSAERIRETVARHTFLIGGGIHLTCSIGVALFPDMGCSRDTLVHHADQAMYAAKQLGRNQVRSANDPAIMALKQGHGVSREETTVMGIIEALTNLIHMRDHYTGVHSQTIGTLAAKVALALGCSLQEAHMIGLVGQLHDIGKIGIPDHLLCTVGQLTPEEWSVVQTHPVIGAEVVSHIPALMPLASAIRAHHERWDGMGYPDHLSGEVIPLAARIVAVVETYDTICSAWPYQDLNTSEEALHELDRGAGSQFDVQVVLAFKHVLSDLQDIRQVA